MIGLDPELAIINKKTGVGRSAHRFINKKKQYKFYYDNDKNKSGYSMLGSEAERDGAAIEFRSIVRSACRDNIIPYVGEAMRQQFLELQKKWNGDWTFTSAPVFQITKADLKDAPSDVFEFGCRPDCDAYSLNVKDPQLPQGDLRRYTGGHIHYSPMRANKNIEQQAALAILFDYMISVPMVAILGEKFADGEAERREFYGQPGSFRYDDQKSKIEFRTLSGRLLLHPTLMYWVLGMMKTMHAAVGRGGYKDFLKTQLVPAIEPQVVYETVLTHDVEAAEKLCDTLFKLLPAYKENKNDLANPMSGGGAGTQNPYFFEQALRVFVKGNHEGVTFADDVQHNWGLYENYEIKHHSYWGIQQAMVGLLDDDIFPQNAILDAVWPKEFIQEKPVWQHPLNGGYKKYVTRAAAGWLA